METTYFIFIFFALMFSEIRSEDCTSVVEDGKEVPRKEAYYKDSTRSFGKPGSNKSRSVMKKSCEKNTMSPVDTVVAKELRDCAEIQASGKNTSGVYSIHLDGAKYPFNVYCDMETDGGGWTVFQRRSNRGNTLDFSRDWVAYKNGFGSIDSDYWLGNDKLHQLSNQKAYQLRIDLDFSYVYGKYTVSYSHFDIGNETTKYILTVDGYSGDAGDDLSYLSGSPFITNDDDEESCFGGWWRSGKTCSPTRNLNGNSHYFVWYPLSVEGSEMKIRPV